jgi:hypothetical protein
MTMEEFIALADLGFCAKPADSNPNLESEQPMDHWLCTLSRPKGNQGRRMTVTFSMGEGHGGKAPELAQVLSSLALDASGDESANTFQHWCDEFGFDADSRRAHRTFLAAARQTKALKRFLGEELYRKLLWETDLSC